VSQATLPGRRESTKAANRAAILDAARAIFADIGYGAATVRDIVRRTDLATGTFYNYFPDKESVLRALVEDNATTIRASLREARGRATTFEEFVREGYRVYFEYMVSDRPTFELMRRNAGTIRELVHEPALGAGINDLVEDLQEWIPDLDTSYVGAAMTGVGIEVAILVVDRDPPDVEGATRFATDLFIGGLKRLARA
jgi:AcrR family transcriptional regulator